MRGACGCSMYQLPSHLDSKISLVTVRAGLPLSSVMLSVQLTLSLLTCQPAGLGAFNQDAD